MRCSRCFLLSAAGLESSVPRPRLTNLRLQQYVMTDTTTSEAKEEPKGIVIRIKPRTVARCISVGLGVAIHVCTMLKTMLDESLMESDEEDVTVCEAVPVLDEKDVKEEEEDVEIECEAQVEKVDWNGVEKCIQDGVESVDWDQVGKSIKAGVESVDWTQIGNTLEEWSRSVDWDQVGKSISDAFDENKANVKKNEM